jgi:hypothetical protein
MKLDFLEIQQLHTNAAPTITAAITGSSDFNCSFRLLRKLDMSE